MNLGQGVTTVGVILSLSVGGITLSNAMRGRNCPAKTIVSQAGRDQAVIRMLQGARMSVYLRTETLALVPIGNELAQALQRKASVTLELPLDVSLNAAGSQLPRILMDLGAVVTFKSDADGNYRGTYMVVDGFHFLYSASSLTLSTPGSMVSYVTGSIER